MRPKYEIKINPTLTMVITLMIIALIVNIRVSHETYGTTLSRTTIQEEATILTAEYEERRMTLMGFMKGIPIYRPGTEKYRTIIEYDGRMFVSEKKDDYLLAKDHITETVIAEFEITEYDKHSPTATLIRLIKIKN